MDAFKMIDAPSVSSGRAFWTVNRSPFTLMSKIESKNSSVILPKGEYFATPALANTISSLPFSRLICANRRSRSPVFDTSPSTPVTFLPISFTAAANSGSRRPIMKTYAPSFTNSFAVARPMPLLPPVTSAIFPSSLPIYFSLLVILFLISCDDGLNNEHWDFTACTGPVAREFRIGGVGPRPPLVLLLAEDFAGAHLVLDRTILQLDKRIGDEVVIPERILGCACMRSDYGVNAVVFDPHQRDLTDLARLCALA